MPRLLYCPRGHRWHESADIATAESAMSCPICGMNGSSAEDPPTTGFDRAPTVVQTTPSLGQINASYEQAPPVLPEFDILEEIGRGGMGMVYRARRREDGHIVAVKVIRKDRLQHEESVRRFRREAQAAARLSHPNIVSVLDSDHAGDTHFLVMEYVAGSTLEKVVETDGPLSVPDACECIRQAALGLQHAHEQALVHRDIKPSNFMISTNPAGERVIKMLDLGVARMLTLAGATPTESLSTLTQGGSVIGTADFVAPEQLENPHAADIRADLYSLGCTFYFVLTGTVPFPGGSLISKLDKQRWQDPTPIENLRGDVPQAVSRVVARLMEKKPANRFDTPGELVEALTTLANNAFDDPPAPPLEIREIRRCAGHADAVWCVRFSPDGTRIASAGKDGLALLWDAQTGQQIRKFYKHPGEVRAVAFAPADDLLATASGFTVRLFNTRTGAEVRKFSGHTASVKCLVFSADGKRLISGGDDKTIRLWDTQTGREVQRFTRHAAGVNSLAYIGQTNRIVSASRDQTVRVWDVRSGLESDCFDAQAGNVLDVAVSPDGTRIASAHFDTILRIWDIPSAQKVGECIGHKQMVSALAFTPDGSRLVSAGQDQTVRLWELGQFAELTSSPRHAAGLHAMAVAPDGKCAAIAAGDKHVLVWALP